VDVQLRNGIYLPGPSLWLDPKRKAPIGIVSHAHSDHAGWHELTIATPATMDLMKARKEPPASARLVELMYREPFTVNGTRITLFPAGHILGSAQVLVETKGGSLLYTGDFKRRESLTCEGADSVKAGTLVMECTFGHPRYAFPPVATVRQNITDFCKKTLGDGLSPVLLAYSLGKSQELLALLVGSGLEVVVHRSIRTMSAVYEKHGVDLGTYKIWSGQNHEGRVLIVPPGSQGASQRPEGTRTAVITGWAMDSKTIYRHRCEAAFPLSDHADHGELLEHVEETGAKKVFTVHGFTEQFAADLRYFGIDALALGGGNQLELFR